MIGELLALRQGYAQGQCEAVVEVSGDRALDPADLVDVADHALADGAFDGRDHGDTPGRHVDGLARKLLPVFQHIAAEHRDPYALIATAFAAAGVGLGQRGQDHRGSTFHEDGMDYPDLLRRTR